jgi:hypothetical protein
MALRLNRKLYRKSAVDSACKDFKARSKEDRGYFVIDIDGKDAGEFANYVLAMMKAN